MQKGKNRYHFIAIGEHKKETLENYKNVQKQPLAVFYKKAVLKNFAVFIGKTRVGVSF